MRRQEKSVSAKDIHTVFAIDQSFTCCGFSLVKDGTIQAVYSKKFPAGWSKTEKRAWIAKQVHDVIARDRPDVILVERVRLFGRGVISVSSIIALSSIVAAVVDVAELFKVPVYSADTRSWKFRVLGSASASKEDTVKFVRGLGWNVANDDEADACCIGLYPWKAEELYLKREH